jgi:predicted transcriptional regulator
MGGYGKPMMPRSNVRSGESAPASRISPGVPDLETAYRSLRPMLFGALGKLSRQGFSVLPSDGLDMIHDFFVDEWAKVSSHYDPGKGKLESYVYAAFVNFARPRLIRLQRLQRSLVDPQELSQLAEEEAPLLEDPRSLESQLVFDRLLSRLPSEDCALLSMYVRSGRSPERALARARGVSRYQLREQLIASLGRFAVLLGQPPGIPDRDWRVALALWRDQRSISEAARVLGVTDAQARNAQKRNAKYLAEALRVYQASQKGARKTMTETQSYADMLGDALLSVNSAEHLQVVRTHAEAILQELEQSEEDPLEGRLAEVDAGWMARVYEALSHEDEFLGEDQELLERLFQAKQTEERDIGIAFEQALLVNLPDDVLRWKGITPLRTKVPALQEAELLKSPSVGDSVYVAEFLVPFGMTPLTVFRATEAIGGLAERLIRRGRLEPDRPIALSALNRDYAGLQQLDFSMTCSEVGLVTGLSEPNSTALTKWCIRAAQYKQTLFPWLSSDPLDEEAVRMVWAGESADNLYQRWTKASVVNV